MAISKCISAIIFASLCALTASIPEAWAVDTKAAQSDKTERPTPQKTQGKSQAKNEKREKSGRTSGDVIARDCVCNDGIRREACCPTKKRTQ